MPSVAALADLRGRTAVYYGREMTPRTASVAADLVWTPFAVFA